MDNRFQRGDIVSSPYNGIKLFVYEGIFEEVFVSGYFYNAYDDEFQHYDRVCRLDDANRHPNRYILVGHSNMFIDGIADLVQVKERTKTD
jgi:hypothetical protein